MHLWSHGMFVTWENDYTPVVKFSPCNRQRHVKRITSRQSVWAVHCPLTRPRILILIVWRPFKSLQMPLLFGFVRLHVIPLIWLSLTFGAGSLVYCDGVQIDCHWRLTVHKRFVSKFICRRQMIATSVIRKFVFIFSMISLSQVRFCLMIFT